MEYIKNLRTKKTETQIADEWAKVKAYKVFLLSSTDWTQLNDVILSNQEEIDIWRGELRTKKLREEFNTYEDALNFLETHKEKLPEPRYETSSTTLIDPLDPEANSADELDIIDARDIIVKDLEQEYHDKLIEIGVLEFPLILNKFEQALDYLSSNSINRSEYPLLSGTNNVKSIIEDYKAFLKELTTAKNESVQKRESVYNMDRHAINEYFVNNGYRYRCIK